MWTTTARGALEDNDIFGNAFSGVESRWSEERGDQNDGSADSSSRRWSDFRSACDDAA